MSHLVVKKEEEKLEELKKREEAKRVRSVAIEEVQRAWATRCEKKSFVPSSEGFQQQTEADDEGKELGYSLRQTTQLFIFGNEFSCLDKTTADTTSLSIQYFSLQALSNTILIKIKSLVNVHSLELSDNNIVHLWELNRLGCLTNIQELTIQANPVVESPLFRLYAVYRLLHVTMLNGVRVSDEERLQAERQFSALGGACFSRHPPPWINRHLLPWAVTGIPAITHDTGARAQGCAPVKQSNQHAKVAKDFMHSITEHAIMVDEKIEQLNTLWPNLILGMVQQLVLDLKDEDSYAEAILRKF